MKRLFVLLLLILPVTAAAQQANHWDYVGNWDVDYYPEMRGCAATVEFNDGTNFLIGIDSSSGQLMLAIAILHRAWSSIAEGGSYDLTVQFDSRPYWDITATGTRVNAFYGLMITEPVGGGNAAAFVGEFQRGYWMTWRHQGEVVGKLSLNGSRRAFDSALACSKAWLR